MSETPVAPEEAAETAAAAATPSSAAGAETPAADAAPVASDSASELGQALKEQEVSIHSLIEAGAHYGHQPGRWNPQMRSYIFGERNGTHIIDLDQTLPLLQEGLDFLRETTAAGGKVLQDQDYQRFFRDAVRPMASGGFFNTEERASSFLSGNMRAVIVNALRRNNVPVTEDNIQKYYKQMGGE